MRLRLAAGLVLSLFNVGGVSASPAEPPAPEPMAAPVSAWPRPVILPVEIPPEAPSKDWNQLSLVPGKGLVTGTREAISSIGRPLYGADVQDRALSVCMQALWNQASKAGAESIEGVYEGPEQKTRDGRIFAPVTMRLAYAKPNVSEVKKSTAICVIDRDGQFVDLYIPDPAYRAGSRRSDTNSYEDQWSRLQLVTRRPVR